MTVSNPQPQHVNVNGISISQTNLSMYKGDSYRLSDSISPSNASNQGSTWSSNNTNIIRVNSDGTCYAQNTGSCVVSVTSNEGNYTVSCNVTVSERPSTHVAVQSVSMKNASMTVAIGAINKCRYSIYPENATNQYVSWSSTAPNVASVDTEGNIKGHSCGTAIITVRTGENNYTSICYVTVVNVPTTATKSTTAVTGNSTTHDPTFMYNTTVSILQAKKNGVVKVTGLVPMAFDRNVATALAQRPDVTLEAIFPFQGHEFALILPAGFNLAAHLGTNGYAEWLNLCSLQPAVTLQLLK